MDEQKREFLEQRYAAPEWRGQSTRGVLTNFRLTGSEIADWTLVKAQRDEAAEPQSIRSLWRRGDAADELLSVRVVECASAAAAHDQVIEELGNFESAAIERRTGANAVGDVAFGLGTTMVLFARANMVVAISNAGPKVVSVVAIAREIDSLIRQRLE